MKRLYLKIIVLSALLLLNNINKIKAQSGNIEFQSYTTADGMSSNWYASSLVQDDDGYLWVAKLEGLDRFDGYKFKTYTYDSTKSNSLNAELIFSIFLDSQKRLWIDGFRGDTGILSFYNKESDDFSNYDYKSEFGINQFARRKKAFYEDNSGNIWLGTSKGIVCFDPNKKRFIHNNEFSHLFNKISNENIVAILQDSRKNFWFGTYKNGLIKYSTALKRLTRFKHIPTNINSLLSNNISSIYEDTSGVIFIGTENSGLHFYNSSKDRIIRLPENTGLYKYMSAPVSSAPAYRNNGAVNIISRILDGSFWIGTVNGGLKVYNNDFSRYELYKFDSFNKRSLSTNILYSIYQDNQDNIWIGTVNRGILKVIPSHFIFKPSNYGLAPLENPQIRGVLSIFESKDKSIWVGTVNGYLIKYNPIKNETLEFKYDFKKSENQNGLRGNDLDAIIEDNEGIIWIATINGISKYNPKTSLLTDVHFKINGMIDKGAYDTQTIIEDGEYLWIGTFNNGLFKFNKKTDNTEQFFEVGSNSTTIPFNIHCLLKTKKGEICVGTDQGLRILGKSKGKYRNYLSGNFIISIFEDHIGYLWVSTDKGLFKLDTEKNIRAHYDENNGLPSNWIGGILSDKNNILWIATSKGLVRFEQGNGSFLTYNAEDGALKEYFYDGGNSVYKTSSGLLLFGSHLGLTVFDPEKIKLNHHPPNVLITKLVINNSENDSVMTVYNRKHDTTNNITLSYSENEISFNYVGIHFKNPERNKYKYKLDPYDDHWLDAGNLRSARYTNLDPGEYTFKVSAANSDGIWSENFASIIVTINPPWWQTWWAYFLYFLALAIVLGGVRKFELNRRKEKENKRLLQLENERKTIELEQAKEIEKAYQELKSTQAQLVHSEKMASLGELTAGIAHEIKNPLNFVNNFSEVSRELLDDIKTGLQNKNNEEVAELIEDLKQNLEKIDQHGKRADSIVKGMLLHSRGTAGEKILTDINDLLDQYVNLAYHGMRAHNKEFNITIEKDYDETLEKINVVPQDISRVFLNIINNACYAAFNRKNKSNDNNYSPTLKVSTKNLNGKVEIRIGDNGNGIPTDILDKIFQPFFTTKPTGEGTGLGLSLSYDIITKVHGGELKVETIENEGTNFKILLPKH